MNRVVNLDTRTCSKKVVVCDKLILIVIKINKFLISYFLFPYSGGKTWVLSSTCKTELADFTDWISSYHLNPWRKSVLIQTLSAQIPNAFHHHEKAEKSMI